MNALGPNPVQGTPSPLRVILWVYSRLQTDTEVLGADASPALARPVTSHCVLFQICFRNYRTSHLVLLGTE